MKQNTHKQESLFYGLSLQSQPVSTLSDGQFSFTQNLLTGCPDQNLVDTFFTLPHILNLVPEAGSIFINSDANCFLLSRL